MERYLFGDDPDEKRFFKKTQKNPNHLQNFWKDTCLETITGRKKICKKVQKKSPTRAIFGKILIGKRGGFLINHKKILKKVHFFQPLSFFSGRYLVTAKKRPTIFPMPGRKKLEIMEKNQTTSGFLSKILVWSNPMATLTTTLSEQKGKSMNNTS